MNVTNPDLVIVRGINSDWFEKNFSEFWIGFGGTPQATPKEDAYYVGLYLEAPVSAITHIGIVERIDRYDNGADFYLKALIKLKNKVVPGHAIRKHENWNLSQFGLTRIQMDNFRLQLNSI
nr:hypothetical protein [uncultured Flavobacterium sp.]